MSARSMSVLLWCEGSHYSGIYLLHAREKFSCFHINSSACPGDPHSKSITTRQLTTAEHHADMATDAHSNGIMMANPMPRKPFSSGLCGCCSDWWVGGKLSLRRMQLPACRAWYIFRLFSAPISPKEPSRGSGRSVRLLQTAAAEGCTTSCKRA